MKLKKLKSMLACVLVLCMAFDIQSNFAFVFAQGNDYITEMEDETDITNNATDTMTYNINDANIKDEDDVSTKTESEPMFGNCGATENDNITWKLEQNKENNDYTLTISGTGVMVDYGTNVASGDNHSPWCWNRQHISKVVVEEGVSHIGNYAFASFSILRDVELADSIKSIGFKAFNTSGKLNATGFTVKFPKYLETIDDSVFTDSNLAGDIELPATLTTIGDYAFKNIAKVSSLKTTSKTLYIGVSAFSANPSLNVIDWTSIETLTLPEVSVINSSMLFQGCKDTIVYVRDKAIANKIIGLINHGYYNDVHLGTIAITDGGTFADGKKHELLQFSIPQKDGFIFDGWYQDTEFINKVTTVGTYEPHYVKWIEKTSATVSFKDDLNLDKTYDGKATSLSPNDYTVTEGAGNTVFSYQAKDGNNWKDIDTAPTNVGTYRVKAIVAENDSYKGTETDWKEFTISKATPMYNVPSGLIATVGQTLADVKLPDDFTWQDALTTSVGNVGINTFKVTYTPTDTVNYNTVTDIEITLTVNPKIEEPNELPIINASDKTLPIGDTFNPLDGVTASDKEDGDLTNVIEVLENTVDTTKTGTYIVTYKVTDSKGASSTRTITVTVKEKDTPLVPDKPDEPSKPEKGNNAQIGVQTGDATNLFLWGITAVLSAFGILLITEKKLKENRD